MKFNTFDMETRARVDENEGIRGKEGGTGMDIAEERRARRRGKGERERDGRRGGKGVRALQRHITNAIPDPHGFAHIALLFGFN